MTNLTHFNPEIRRIFDDETQQWYFAVVDVIKTLTDSNTPRRYWSDMKRREKEIELSAICVHFPLINPKNNRKYQTECANLEGIFRIIQSIPSKKAEPVKRWLAQVGQERLEEYEAPQKAIERLKEHYRKLGREEKWISERIKNITTRNELTDEWQSREVKEGRDMAILTAIIHKGAFDVSIKDHKEIKHLKRENLRDHMTTLELALSSLAEAATAEITRNMDAQGFEENREAAIDGGNIAGNARKQIEEKTGKPVVSTANHLSEEEKKRRGIE